MRSERHQVLPYLIHQGLRVVTHIKMATVEDCDGHGPVCAMRPTLKVLLRCVPIIAARIDKYGHVQRRLAAMPVRFHQLEIRAQQRQQQFHQFIMIHDVPGCSIQCRDRVLERLIRQCVNGWPIVGQVRPPVPGQHQSVGLLQTQPPQGPRDLVTDQRTHRMAKKDKGAIQMRSDAFGRPRRKIFNRFSRRIRQAALAAGQVHGPHLGRISQCTRPCPIDRSACTSIGQAKQSRPGIHVRHRAVGPDRPGGDLHVCPLALLFFHGLAQGQGPHVRPDAFDVVERILF